MKEMESSSFVLREGGELGIGDGCHCLEGLLDISWQAGTDDGQDKETIYVFVYQRHDSAVLSHCKIIMPRQTANSNAAIVRRHSQLMGLMQGIITYALMFGLNYSVLLILERGSEFRRDMSASDVLCGVSNSTCLHYVRMAKLFIKILYFCELVRARREWKFEKAVLGVTHLVNSTLYTKEVGDGILLA